MTLINIHTYPEHLDTLEMEPKRLVQQCASLLQAEGTLTEARTLRKPAASLLGQIRAHSNQSIFI